jgi:copper(I)-binding protein
MRGFMQKTNGRWRYLFSAGLGVLCYCFIFQCAAASHAVGDIRVTNAVVYVPLGANKNTIALFSLRNNTAQPVAIVKVSSKAITKIELVPATAVAASAPNPWVTLAFQTLVLNPKNQYLQLTGLKTRLATGDELELTLTLSNGKKLTVIAQAKSAYDQRHW